LDRGQHPRRLAPGLRRHRASVRDAHLTRVRRSAAAWQGSARDSSDPDRSVHHQRQVRDRDHGRTTRADPRGRAVDSEFQRPLRPARRLLARRLRAAEERWLRQRLTDRRPLVVRVHRTEATGGLARRALAAAPRAVDDAALAPLTGPRLLDEPPELGELALEPAREDWKPAPRLGIQVGVVDVKRRRVALTLPLIAAPEAKKPLYPSRQLARLVAGEVTTHQAEYFGGHALIADGGALDGVEHVVGHQVRLVGLPRRRRPQLGGGGLQRDGC